MLRRHRLRQHQPLRAKKDKEAIMTTNPYENTTSPTSLPSYMPMAPADGEFPSIEQYPETDMPGQAQGRSGVDSEFFPTPEIAPAKIDEIDTTGWSESAKAALAQLDGRG